MGKSPGQPWLIKYLTFLENYIKIFQPLKKLYKDVLFWVLYLFDTNDTWMMIIKKFRSISVYGWLISQKVTCKFFHLCSRWVYDKTFLIGFPLFFTMKFPKNVVVSSQHHTNNIGVQYWGWLSNITLTVSSTPSPFPFLTQILT